MSEALLRQRRNLILFSAILLFLSLGNVDITMVSVLGIDFNFKTNIKIVYVSIWLIWAYFLYRYLTYYASEGKQEFLRVKVSTFDEVINPKIKNHIYSIYSEPNDGCGYSYGNLVNSKMVYFGQAYKDIVQENGATVRGMENYELDFSKVWKLKVWRAQALITFMFIRPSITDYIFPFVFSGFALSVGIISKWPGNPIGLFT